MRLESGIQALEPREYWARCLWQRAQRVNLPQALPPAVTIAFRLAMSFPPTHKGEQSVLRDQEGVLGSMYVHAL